ncbi:MAG: adenylyl-sulfate kinase [Bacteroidota bacterium]|nr:adenylyl-sulfate kinase [Bacteroidota bacterium]
MLMQNLYSTKDSLLSRKDKEKLLNQKGICVWLTGLSGSGKTTIANFVSRQLHNGGVYTQVLDGDNIRLGINKNLSFSDQDRKENIRRIAEVAKLFVEAGVVTFCCFVSPTREMRKLAKNVIGENDFFEVFVSTNLETCETRDVKGLYKKARRGEIKDFTGVSSPFESPENPDLVLNTEDKSINEIGNTLISILNNKLK